MPNRIIGFTTGDSESSAEIQALDAADLDGLGAEYKETCISVNLSGARLVSNEVWISVTGDGDLELLQHYFNQPIRWVSRSEQLVQTSGN